ncbi:MAG: DJ-1/PfpI family protein [Oscillospiraceae bacterium]|jgi:4-methyl-5(b-hydroxyethyl)-thiazole monophosphate biosynthesis|nr:DJ-1/PfpI family protein [Oscillospiraceae bacterium]
MVCVLLSEGFEEVEAVTVLDYLRRAGIDAKSIPGGEFVARVKGSHGIKIELTAFEPDYDNLEMIVLPGGQPGTNNLRQEEAAQKLILYAADNNIPIGAICAAPTILAGLGLLEGKRATCFPSCKEQMAGAIYTGAAVETDGLFTTSRSAGTAHLFALELIRILRGKELAQRVADGLHFE